MMIVAAADDGSSCGARSRRCCVVCPPPRGQGLVVLRLVPFYTPRPLVRITLPYPNDRCQSVVKTPLSVGYSLSQRMAQQQQ